MGKVQSTICKWVSSLLGVHRSQHNKQTVNSIYHISWTAPCIKMNKTWWITGLTPKVTRPDSLWLFSFQGTSRTKCMLSVPASWNELKTWIWHALESVSAQILQDVRMEFILLFVVYVYSLGHSITYSKHCFRQTTQMYQEWMTDWCDICLCK